ncbi:stage 0 sporulation protein [Candidatus Epulonipiscium fishelsonii]|uniref:Stage 0 sporulation protein n=1 Tax=Candidatus Epulonipiscium fishelsonii TaxID=77094 RepID=A0ACC8XGY3_9FIRM|nr:stage 0 sporulation protein [Epulopiscium sp. SCG-B05WGA-EpuloA1]ONI42710.1 stage 0 sporulation protein [Epulopiscium sp. SCG-B11WGA-EpuloA1]ONI47034.1 stage 0 sporulation protein [Epulopiscium sp. SCG-C06WGA-EpuloA1]
MIGVRFRTAGKICYFDNKEKKFEVGQNIIVETSKGIECGEVILTEIDKNVEVTSGSRVIRVVNEEDKRTLQANKIKEKEAFFICKDKILKHKLNMKLIEAEYLFDGNKLLFYFTSDDRIDFRELVKELAAIFRTRIELRQIGVRDETKMCGGIGICGRKLCCSTFLEGFHPVSIKMAKDQSLSLNPVKISGICGRLMCCLKYEEDCYVEIRERLPDVGDIVLTPDGKGEVLAVNVLREQVKVAVKIKAKDEKEAILYNSSQIKIKKKCNKHCGGGYDDII